MESQKETHLKSLLLLLVLAALAVSGCREVYIRNPFSTEPPIILRPIDKLDILSIPAGSLIYTEPNGLPLVIQKDGWFVSDFYISEVMRARTE